MTELSGAEADRAYAFLAALIAAQKDGEDAVQARVAEQLQGTGCMSEERPYDPTAVPMVGEFAIARAQNPQSRTNVTATLLGREDRRSFLVFARPDSDPTQNGRTHEWVDREDCLRTATATADLIVNWCGAQKFQSS